MGPKLWRHNVTMKFEANNISLITLCETSMKMCVCFKTLSSSLEFTFGKHCCCCRRRSLHRRLLGCRATSSYKATVVRDSIACHRIDKTPLTFMMALHVLWFRIDSTHTHTLTVSANFQCPSLQFVLAHLFPLRTHFALQICFGIEILQRLSAWIIQSAR